MVCNVSLICAALVMLLLPLCATLSKADEDTRPVAEIVEARKIWDRAPHNAFTDLIRFNGMWYCAFREGDAHVCDNGRMRVIRSRDGNRWESVALMDWDGGDLRDAKLSITPKNELMLTTAVRFLEPVNGNRHQSLTWLSPDGDNWSGPYACETGLGTWRWSTIWHNRVAYNFGYSGKDTGGCLYRSMDGKSWKVLADDVFPTGDSRGNETSIVFQEDGTALCLLRDGPGRNGFLGSADPPYIRWTWKDLRTRIGGPKMIRLQDGRYLAGVRLHEHPSGGEKVRTSLVWIDPEEATLTEFLELPSGGDTSYPGLVEHEGLVWVSYYSSHEGKSAIYLAKVRLAD